MADEESVWVSHWIVLATLLGAVVSALGYTVGLPYVKYVTVFTALGVTYILYRWGQYREGPSKSSNEPEQRRREKEMEAEAGGYGGNP